MATQQPKSSHFPDRETSARPSAQVFTSHFPLLTRHPLPLREPVQFAGGKKPLQTGRFLAQRRKDAKTQSHQILPTTQVFSLLLTSSTDH